MKIQRLRELHLVKKELETHMSLIKILTPSKTDRHWVIPKGIKQLGWLPHTSQYVPIYATKPVKIDDLNRLLEKNLTPPQ